MDQHSNSYSTCWRSQTDPRGFAEAPADYMVPAAAQESDTFGYDIQPTANPYLYKYAYPSYLAQLGDEATEYGWFSSHSTQDNQNTTLIVQKAAMDLKSETVPPSESSASPNPEFQVGEIKPKPDRFGNWAKRFICLQPDCKQLGFRRAADLDRHRKLVHDPPQPKFRCDYRHCPRAKAGAHFQRQDHFRDHFRDYHKEDLIRRGMKVNKEWWKTRNIRSGWWRCNRCLRRVQEPSGDSDEWACPNCHSTCELERQQERTRENPESA